MTSSNLSISLGSKVDYTFGDKNTFQAKKAIDSRIRSFPHLNRETGKPISHGKQVSEMLGKNLFKWLQHEELPLAKKVLNFVKYLFLFKWLKKEKPLPADEKTKSAFTKRVIGLVKDLKSDPLYKDSVVNFRGENIKYLDFKLLTEAKFSFKIENLFIGPHGGIYNSDFLQALNAHQPAQMTRADLDKKDHTWRQLEKNYSAFIDQLKSEPAQDQAAYKIPKKIHQIWLGSAPKEEVKRVQASFEKFHPGWEVKLWRDQDAKPLIDKMRVKFPNVGEAWDKASKWAEKADILRYCIIYEEGGTYADTDLPCYGAIDEIHAFSEFCVGMERNIHGNDEIFTGNAWISAKAGHPILEGCLKGLKPFTGSKDFWDILYRTGPGLLKTEVYKGLAKDEAEGTQKTLIMPPSYFYPLHTDYRHQAKQDPKFPTTKVLPWTKGLHLWDSSWVD